MILTTIINRVERGRVEELNGDMYTVYPVIMLTEGVHSGSGGATLYTAQELESFAQVWNGVPVTLQHPDLNGVPVSANSPEIHRNQVIGTVFHVQYENGKLRGEIWLKNSSLDSLDPGLKGRLLSGERLEVSTGLFCEDEQSEGTFNNESYVSIARNIRPDHLALLPGSIGACSWEDGCGVRANKTEGEGGGIMIRKKKVTINNDSDDSDDFVKEKEKYFINTENFSINELDYTKIVQLMHSKIDSMDIRGEKVNYLKRVYPSYVVYSIHYMNANEPNKMVKRNYRLVNDGIEWIGDSIQVTEEISYTEINNNTNNAKTNEEEDMADEKVLKTMKECCPDKVDELIKNNENFTEEHKESLLGMTEDAFALTINVAKDIKVVEKVEDIVENEEKDEKDEKVTSLEDLLANAAPELRESIEFGQRELAKKKEGIMARIKSNKLNTFGDDELKGFDMEFLEKLAGMVPAPKQNYALNAGGTVPQETEIEPLPKNNTWEEDKKE